MSLMFKKFGHTPQSLALAKENKTLLTNHLQTDKQLLQAYTQPLPTLEEIRFFETKNNINLPEDYVNFLLTINGGYPNYYYIPTIKQSIDHFYPFNCPFKSSSMNDLLIFNKKDFFKNGHFLYLPIACSLAGDEYVMKLIGNDRFSIYFYNLSNMSLSDFDETALTFVANSFSVFLNLLVDYEEITKL